MLSRYYGLSALGVFTIMSTGATLAAIIAGGGYGTAFLREASRLNATAERGHIAELYRAVGRRLVVRLPLQFILCVAAGFLYSSLVRPLGVAAVLMLSLPVVFLPLITLSSEYFKAIKRAEISVLLNPGVAALLTGCFVLLTASVVASADATSPVRAYGAYVISCAVVCLLGWLLVRAVAKPAIRSSSLDIVRNESTIASSRADYFRAQLYTFFSFSGLFLVAGLSLDESQIGIVRLAERIAAPMALALSVITPLIASDLAGTYARGDIASVRRIVRRTGNVCLGFAVTFATAVIVYIDEIAAASGVETAEVFVPVIVIMVGSAVNLACGPLGTVLNMTRHECDVKRISLITLCASLVFTQMALLVAGIVGFSVALAFSYCLKNALMLVVYRRNFGKEQAK